MKIEVETKINDTEYLALFECGVDYSDAPVEEKVLFAEFVNVHEFARDAQIRPSRIVFDEVEVDVSILEILREKALSRFAECYNENDAS